MGTLAARKPITVERFDTQLDANGYELIDGRLVRKTMSVISSWVQGNLQARLTVYAREHDLGYVFESECSYACFPHKRAQVRKPDVSFVRRERIPGGGLPDGSFLIAPDFIVEVLSPSEKVRQLEDKIADFESVGVPLIWIVSTHLRMVQVRRPGGSIREFRSDEELDADPVVPGFRIRVSDLFPPTVVGAPA